MGGGEVEWTYSRGGSMKEKMGIRVHVVKYIDRIEKNKRKRRLSTQYVFFYIIVFRVASYFIVIKKFPTDR